MMDEKKAILQRYKDCKAERQKYLSLWSDINKYVSIATDINTEFESTSTENKQRDRYINDPSAYIATTQLTDYLIGLIWGTGEEVFDLVPNRYIRNQVDDETSLNDFYAHATEVALEEINHPDAGFLGSLTSFIRGQIDYGTSGSGCFPSKDYIEGRADNRLQFNSYGVYNSCFDEGANAKINVVYSVRNWRLSRIIDEFATKDGEIIPELFEKLPKEFKIAYDKQEFNRKFKIIHGILPHKDYSKGKIGKKGTKFKGFWFYEAEEVVFFEEYYRELPVAICRMINVPNQVYGVSFAGIAISSIKLLNYMAGKGIRSVEKLTDPSTGSFSGALQAGEVVDTSAGGHTVFKDVAQGRPPIFPIADIGDVSALLQLLIPQAKEDIATIFKIDRLLDFNSQVSMTATESMQRFAIKSKSEVGIIIQILHEYLNPTINRSVSLLEEDNAFGVNPDSEEAVRLIGMSKDDQVLPQAVADAIRDGKRWYDIKFKNSISQILNAEKFDWLSKFIMTDAQLLAVHPELSMAIKPYDILLFVKEILSLGNEGFMKSEKEFNEAIQAMQEQQAMMAQAQAENVASGTVKNLAGAEKDAKQSQQQRSGQGNRA